MLNKDDRFDIQEAFRNYVIAKTKEGFNSRIENNNSDARTEAKKLLHAFQERHDVKGVHKLGHIVEELALSFAKDLKDIRDKKFLNNKMRVVVDEIAVPKLLSTGQAADIACITERTIRNWIKSGEVKYKDLNEGTGKKPNYRIFKDSLLKKLGA